MNFESFLDDYLKKCTEQKKYDNFEIGCILTGCRQLYKACGAEKYKSFMLQVLESMKEKKNPYPDFDFCNEEMNIGKSLFLAYDVTGEEQYRKTIETLKKQIDLFPRQKDGRFLEKSESAELMSEKDMYQVLPFYMEYETRYDSKAAYNDIVMQFACREVITEPVWYLMALIDVMEHMSIEIFEHYKSLQEIFKKTIKGVEKQNDTIYNIGIGYAVLKACNMGILNPEKYSETGFTFLDGAIKDPLAWDNHVAAGILMMAYAQSLQFNNNFN